MTRPRPSSGRSRPIFEAAPATELVRDALELANELTMTVYDALYAVLAGRSGHPLVTADRNLHHAISTGSKVRTIWIEDLPAALARP